MNNLLLDPNPAPVSKYDRGGAFDSIEKIADATGVPACELERQRRKLWNDDTRRMREHELKLVHQWAQDQ